MKRLKWASLIICIAFVVSAFVGCNGNTAVDGKDVTKITIWSVDSHSKAVYDKIIAKYNEGVGKEKGISINYVIKEGDTLGTSIQLALQTGDAPDMFGGSLTVKELAEKGNIASIESLPGGTEFLKKYDGMLDPDKNCNNGKTYCVPASTTIRGLIYNKDMFKSAGLVDGKGEPTPPKTYKELREYAKKLTDKGKMKYGIIYPVKWGSGWVGSDITTPMQSSIGHDGYNPVTGKYEYDKLVPMIETFMGMYNDGSVYPGAEGVDNDTARALFASGSIGMKYAYSFDVGVLNDQFKAECDWGVAPLPVLDENEKYYQRATYANTWFMNAKTAEACPEKLMEVLKFFASDEFAAEVYKNGVNIPVFNNIVANAKLGEDAPKGWAEFASLLPISVKYNPSPKTDFSGMISFPERFMENIWSGKKPAKDVVDEYVQDLYKARDKYYKIHADENVNEFINPKWDIRRYK